MAAPGPDLLKPRNDEDAHVESGIQFLSSARYNHRFGVHDPCGTHSIWYCLFLLGLTSSEMAISEISCYTSCKTCDTEAVRGVNCRGEYRCCSSDEGGPRRSLTFPHLFGDRSLFSLSLCGDLSFPSS